MDTSNTVAAVAAAAAAARNVGTSQVTPGTDGSQSLATAPKIQLWTGKNIAFPAGMVSERDRESPKLPPRNQTGPLCPTPANSPVVSSNGLVAAGMLQA